MLFASIADESKRKKIILLIVSVVIFAMTLTGFGIFWNIRHQARVKIARQHCETNVLQLQEANKAWKKLANNQTIRTLIKSDTPEGKKLAKLIKGHTPSVLSCTSDSPEELSSIGAQAIAATQWYSDNAQSIRTAVLSELDKNPEENPEEKKKDKQEIKEDTKAIAPPTPTVRVTPRVQRVTPVPSQTQKQQGKKDEAEKRKKAEADKKAREKAEADKKAREKAEKEKKAREEKEKDKGKKNQHQEPSNQGNQGEQQGQGGKQPDPQGGQGTGAQGDGKNQNPPAPPTPPANPPSDSQQNGGNNGGTGEAERH